MPALVSSVSPLSKEEFAGFITISYFLNTLEQIPEMRNKMR